MATGQKVPPCIGRSLVPASVVSLLGPLRALRVVDFADCDFADCAVLALARHCPHLCSANLSMCDKIGPLALVTLAKSCSRLESLSLECCTLVDDDTVVAIAKHCRTLRALDLSYVLPPSGLYGIRVCSCSLQCTLTGLLVHPRTDTATFSQTSASSPSSPYRHTASRYTRSTSRAAHLWATAPRQPWLHAALCAV